MSTPHPRLGTGIRGLDSVLGGGLPAGRAYVVRGDPGVGKTVLGYNYLTADPDDSALYIGFEEAEADTRSNAAGLGIDLSEVRILDLSPDESLFLEEETGYSVFEPDEVEGQDVFGRLRAELEASKPDRLFVDPLSQLRALTPDDHQFRKRVASMFQYLGDTGCTTVFTTQPGGQGDDTDLEYLADGAIDLRRESRGRSLEVTKLRGSGFQSGPHAMTISEGGLQVFPRLIPDEHGRSFERRQLSSGVEALDGLLGGGIERGTVTVISGPSGVGKSTTAAHVLGAAAAAGERAAGYLFEESVESFTHRATALGLSLEDRVEEGSLRLDAVEPLALSADEFAHRVCRDVEENDTRVVLIDGVAGYRLSLHHDHTELITALHSLCRYLRNVGVTVLLTEEVRAITGGFAATNEEISYIADNILFLRYIEVRGEIRKAIGVLKKRLGGFEPTLRELRLSGAGLEVGPPLENLRGVLTGTPEWDN